MKKILSILVIGFIIFSLTGCVFESKNTTKDSIKFKEEYESINGTKNSSGQTQRTLSIKKDNPFVYSTAKEIVEKIENKDTFYVYFGSSYCPWCRSVIEKAIEVANSKKIKEIYYVDIWDGDHIEILRDTYKLNDEGKPELVSEGGEGYKELLEYLDNVLGDYVLSDEEGNAISVGEKRIFAPNFIYIKEGIAKKLEGGISSYQTGSRDELTEEILKDEEEKFNKFFTN